MSKQLHVTGGNFPAFKDRGTNRNKNLAKRRGIHKPANERHLDGILGHKASSTRSAEGTVKRRVIDDTKPTKPSIGTRVNRRRRRNQLAKQSRKINRV